MKKTLTKTMLLITMISSLVSCTFPSSSSSEVFPEEIINGGFESGDITGWTAKGLGAFQSENITDASTVNDIGIDKVGSYFFCGIESSLPSYTGQLASDYFTLAGIGYISFRIGSGKDLSKNFVEFFKKGETTPLSFTANGSEMPISKIGNADFNGTTITDQMIIQVVNLSDYVGEAIGIVITDQDTSSEITDYSYVNIDDFTVMATAGDKNDALAAREAQLALYAEEPFDEDPTAVTLRNGGFELGDLTGWKILSGQALTASNIISTSTLFWTTRSYHGEGNYLVDGFQSLETETGRLRSEKFTLENKENGGYVSFKMGGAKYQTTYVAIMDGVTNQEIVRVTNDTFVDPYLSQNLTTTILDLSDYMGQVLYFLIVDNRADGDFGAIVVDDFRINMTETDVINYVSELRSWATDLVDVVAASSYRELYHGGRSFPLAGAFPVISETDGFAVSTLMKPIENYDLYNLFNLGFTASDDYTATEALIKTITGITKDGIEQTENLTYASYDLSSEGTYVISFEVKDAYNQTSSSLMEVVVSEGVVYSNTIENGGFETGDLTGWTTVAGTVSSQAILSSSIFWGEQIPYNQSGDFHFDGWSANSVESASYGLRSSTFTFEGSGAISFKMGGNSSAVKVYQSDGTLIGLYRNPAFADINFPDLSQGSRLATMTTYVADLSPYLNQDLYVEIWDLEIVGGWAVAFFDEIVTYYETAPNLTSSKDTVLQNSLPVELPWLTAVNTI